MMQFIKMKLPNNYNNNKSNDNNTKNEERLNIMCISHKFIMVDANILKQKYVEAICHPWNSFSFCCDDIYLPWWNSRCIKWTNGIESNFNTKKNFVLFCSFFSFKILVIGCESYQRQSSQNMKISDTIHRFTHIPRGFLNVKNERFI